MSSDDLSGLTESENDGDSKLRITPAPTPLSQEILPECLSTIEKTGNGLGYSYVRFQAINRNLTDIMLLKDYKHLRYVDISSNRISDLTPLSTIPYLLSLKADVNLLNAGIKKEMKFLQYIDVSKNKFTSMQGLYHSELEILQLKYNKLKLINVLHPDRLIRLHTLELRGNKLETAAGFNLPNLKRLYLAENEISKLDGIDSLIRLVILHLRNNKVQSLDGFSSKMAKLMYLNLRDNKISDFDEEIYKLKCLPALKHLILTNNPLEDEREEMAIDVLIHIPGLARVDKVLITRAEHRAAKNKLKSVLAEAEALKNRNAEEDEIDDNVEPEAMSFVNAES